MFTKSKKIFCSLALATSILTTSAIVYAEKINFTIYCSKTHPYTTGQKAVKDSNDYDNYAFIRPTSVHGAGCMYAWSQNKYNPSIQSERALLHSSQLNVRHIKEYNVSHAPANQLYQLRGEYGNSVGGQPIGFNGTFTP